MKQCTTCKESLELSCFAKQPNGPQGRSTQCKLCRARIAKEKRSTDSGKRIRRNALLKYKYGITMDDYESKLSKQNGRCAICKTDNPGKRGVFFVDHRHSDGKVRGLLCVLCNIGIGWLEAKGENVVGPATLYLKEWE